MTKSRIRTFIFELTNKCNEHCNFCYSLSYQPKETPQRQIGQLSGEEWKKGLENIANYGARSIDFSGGEPTFHKDFIDILSYAKSRNLQTIVSTNGATYNNANIREALATYANCISLSLHGSDALSHDSIKKRPGSFDLALASTKYYSSKTQVKINTVATQENLESIAQIGDVLGIEGNNIIWKISKVLLQGAGAYNRESVDISEPAYDSLQKTVQSKYKTALREGRLLFRKPNENMEPYIVVRSDGTLHIPQGDYSIPLNMKITDDLGLLEKKIEDVTGNAAKFSEKLTENHLKSYIRIEKAQN